MPASPSPRTFTPREVCHLTHGEFCSLPLADQVAFNAAYLKLVADDGFVFLSGDYDRVGSNRRFELGE